MVIANSALLMRRAKTEYYESGRKLWNARAALEAAKLRHDKARNEIRKLEAKI